MNRSVCKEWSSSDIEGSPESPWSQSHRYIFRSRSRSPPQRRWGSRTSGELDLPLQHFAHGRLLRGALPDPQREYHYTLQGHDSGEGIWNNGAGWPYFHGYSASHGMHRRPKQQKTNDIPCKFYAQGQCRHGLRCRYLHDSALKTETGLGVPVAFSVHPNAHNWYPHHNNVPQNQILPTAPVAVHTSSHVLSGYDKENINSQGIFRTDTRDEHNGLQLNCAQRSQNVFLSEDFGSEQPQLLFPRRTSENGIYIDKHKSSHETTGILGVPTNLVATHLPNATASWSWNRQMHQNNFLVLPKKQGDSVDPQAGLNVISTFSLQGQSFSQEAIAAPDLSSHNGHSFNLYGQLPQNLEAVVHVAESKETTGFPKPGQDSGTQSMHNIQNFQHVGVNVQSQGQTLQDVSVVPYSRTAYRVGASIYHNAAASEEAHIINPDLAPSNGMAILTAGPVGKPVLQRNQDPTLVSKSSAAPPSVPSIQQEAAEISVPSDHKIQTIKTETTDDNTCREALSHSVEVRGHAAAWKTFGTALADFVKEQLKKTWDSGNLTREVHKVISRKVIDKVVHSTKNIPDTDKDAKRYLHHNRSKINKLIKEYFDKHGVEFVE